MSALVIGAGSIGSFIQFLIQEVESSELLTRDYSFQLLNTMALRVTGSIDGTLPVKCTSWDTLPPISPETSIFVCTKAHEVESILNALKRRITKQNAIFLCQNGIGIYEMGRNILPHNPVFRLHCWMGIQRKDLRHIHVTGLQKFDLAGNQFHQQFMEHWQQILTGRGIETTLNFNPVLAEWQKALSNIAVNGVCTIANARNGEILDHSELGDVAYDLIEEAINIALLESIELTEDDKLAVFRSLDKTRESINATLADLKAGRHPELEFFNGAVVKAARKHDKKAPVNETILNMVNYIEKTKQRLES
jgi:2-dehydropantoate 2-reductase